MLGLFSDRAGGEQQEKNSDLKCTTAAALNWQKRVASALAAFARGVYLSNAIMVVGSRGGVFISAAAG